MFGWWRSVLVAAAVIAARRRDAVALEKCRFAGCAAAAAVGVGR